MNKKGTLYVISTPIGNRDDITMRALHILAKCDIIASEDTRHSGMLLSHYGIKGHYLSYNDKNKNRRIPLIVNMLNEGKSIGLISDAGTPLISDPGYGLINAAIDANIDVVPVPGASSVLTALVGSGLPTDSFIFFGFLPKKGKKKALILQSIAHAWQTSILFESPFRIQKTLQLILEHCGNRKVVIARELTKIHEEFIRGYVEEMIIRIKEGNVKLKGEFVILIEGNNA
ncbi:16S rRNA (cytidine(1402)-2'-O)-methyltransferase [candidate division WOR-3 bacterium]|nr:16S rRNA (cytidine(1402)-2'-O)-methyltransferase [candidate division WOR-3 bacterium]